MTRGIFECTFLFGSQWAFDFSDGPLETWEPSKSQTFMGALPSRIASGEPAPVGLVLRAVIDAVNEKYPDTNLRPHPSGRFVDAGGPGQSYVAIDATWDQVP